ncbi:MAG: prevent-host-death protein [Patescibacteria group bacterium]
MNNIITANDLKLGGVSALEPIVTQGLEAIITVHGKNTYVVLSNQEYSRLRECELAVALSESEADVAAGHYHEDSVEDHLNRIANA